MDCVYSLSELSPKYPASQLPTHILALASSSTSLLSSFSMLLVSLMVEVGFEPDPVIAPDLDRVRFSTLDGEECDCSLLLTKAGPVLLVQGHQGMIYN
jgi:hypothetical protein